MIQDIYAKFGADAYKVLKNYNGMHVRIWKNNQKKQPIIKDFLLAFNEQEVLNFFSRKAGQVLKVYSAEAGVIKFTHRQADRQANKVLKLVLNNE
jgi:hypothetical protein